MKLFIGLLYIPFKIFYSIFVFFFGPEKVIAFDSGWDTLPFFSKYSYGGLPREKFLKFLDEPLGKKITSDEYYKAIYGTTTPTWYQVIEKNERSDRMKKIFKWRKWWEK